MIRWITEALGTAAFTDPEIDAALAVVDVRDLVDKHGNPADATREKIEQGVALLRQGRRLVVCCDYGISRSNAVAAGVLSRLDGVSLEAAVHRVMKATGELEIKLEPLRSVRAALATGAEPRDAGAPRVLITGGAGFVGGRLRAALGDALFHCAPSRREADLVAGALELDLLVKEHRINCIVHLANPRVYTSNKALGETVTMLRNTLEVCRDNDLRLVYPSGWEVYSGYRGNELLANEAVPPLPKGPYGEAKGLCEYLIELHRAHYGLRCAILRSSPLYGVSSDRPKFIYNFLAKALRGETIRTHRYLNGDPRLDLLFVDDFVAALSLAVRVGFVGTLNIGSEQTVSTREIAEWIVHQCGSTSRVESQQIEDYAPNIAMNHERARRALGWSPRTTWQVGLAEIIRSKTATHPTGAQS
jgi:nucleoside-diphosphate-sugar epimerase